jgi:acetylornithine deacetylase
MTPQERLDYLRRVITSERCKQLLIELVRVPSPQTALMEAEPLLRRFIETAVEPRLRAMGFADIRYDAMGNLISSYGANRSGKSLMLITNAMNQPQATMRNAYAGDVADGAQYGLPGEVVLGKGASEQKANMTAMLTAMDAVIASGVPIAGRLVALCCLSGETGRHDAIRSVIEGERVHADMAMLGGLSNELSLGNRGRIDVFITVHGTPAHSSRPQAGCNAITGALEVARRLAQIKLERVDPHLGPASLTINRIRSFPESTHTIQASCELTVDRRLLPGEDPDAAFAEIAAVAREVDGMPDPVSGKPFRVEVTLGPFMYPSLVTTDAPVVQELFAASQEALGTTPKTFYSTNAFDQGYLNHVGIPTVNWGPGEGKYAHTDLDMASVERTRDAALVYATMLFRRLT